MSEPIDIAVDLGAVPAGLPKTESWGELARHRPAPPPQLIRGVLHQTSKMILAGTSKSNKSWSLLDLAISVASGQEWWGHRCEKSKVAYLNFELPRWSIAERIDALLRARPECVGVDDNLILWNLRGKNADLTLLRPQLEAELARHQFGLIILDPAYKLLGNRDENSNGEIADLMNEFEALAQSSGAAIVIAHHFAKGDSSAKSAIDRSSGAGVWSRDPDTIFTLSPHEEDECYTASITVRHLPKQPDFVLAWDYPLMRIAKDLNPDALRRPQSKNKKCKDKEFMDAILTEEGKSYGRIMNDARTLLNISTSTAERSLKRLKKAGLVTYSGGLYWPTVNSVTSPKE
jgi:hypothetical protein